MTTTARAFLDAHTEQPLSDPGNLSTTTDWDTLVRMWESTRSGGKQRRLIEEQMAVVLPSILEHTTDWDTLVRMRGSTGSGGKPEQLIEEQMAVVYEQVVCTLTEEAIPPWLDAIMREYLELNSWPSCLDKALLTQRLESIL